MDIAKKITSLKIKLSLTFIILSISIYFLYNYALTKQKNNYLLETTNTYTKVYNTVYNQYKEMSSLVFTGLVEFTNAKKVFSKLKDLDTPTKNRLREEFYKKTLFRYRTLKKKHIKSINFILADNTMFLKMNNPKSYGFKISKKRHSVHYVHKNKKPIDTYEMGKHGEGFKFLYPIIDKGTYLGLIEITFGAEAITATIMKQYDALANFHINAKNFTKSLLSKKNTPYKRSIHEGYLLDKRALRELKKVTKQDMKNVLPLKETIKKVYKSMQKNTTHSIYDKKFAHIFTILPITHTLTKQKDGVFIIRSKNDTLNLIESNYYTGLGAIYLFIFLILYIIYQKVSKTIYEHKKIEDDKKRDKKLLEQEKYLREQITISENELKKIFDNAQVGLMYISGERTLIKANQALADIFGYTTTKEMIGISMKEFHLSEKNFIEYKEQNFDTLKSGAKGHIEYPLRKKDGSTIWCELSGKAIDNNIPADLSKGVLWVINDISLKKEYQERLEKQKEELETLFNHTHDGIAVTNLKGDFLNMNKGFCKITGFSKGELLTKNCQELTAPEDKEKNFKTLTKAIETNQIQSIEKDCVLNDNKKITVNMSVSLLPDKKRLLLIIHDTTTQKIFQEQSKMASMGEMIANIAHQWRQPLSVISTGATGLKIEKEYNTLTDETFYNICDNINNNAQYLSRTIDDFKNFIKGDRQKQEFYLTDNINSFLNLIDGSIKNHNLKMILDYNKNINIQGYPNEIIQCLINIFNNAKDALKNISGEKYIFISTHLKKDKVVITFKDNAGGIPEDILPHIFEPYFTTKHKSQGTGLGLSMTYNLIVDGMKGTIKATNSNYEYNNKEYKGAEFRIILPLK